MIPYGPAGIRISSIWRLSKPGLPSLPTFAEKAEARAEKRERQEREERIEMATNERSDVLKASIAFGYDW